MKDDSPSNSFSNDFSGMFQLAEDFEPTPPETPKPPSSTGQGVGVSEGPLSSVEIESEMPPDDPHSPPPAQEDIIRLACKACGRKVRVKKNRSGQKIKCPKCENLIRIPRVIEPSGNDDRSPRQVAGSSKAGISFADMARRMQSSESETGTSSSEVKKPNLKKTLSGRKYRQLTKLLALKDSLNAEQLRQRADNLKELGQSGDCRAYEWLSADLEHPELLIRQAAAVGLGELGDALGVPLLVGLLDDDSMVMRKAAVLGLGKIKDPRAVEPLLLFGLHDPQMKFLASEAVLGLGQEAVQALIELLEQKELGIVLEAVVLLGRLKDPKARRALTAVIDARRPLLQCHAIEALGQIADPKSIGSLARLLDDPDANVRMSAAAALAKMAADKNIVAPLVKALEDPDADVVVHAAKGLGDSGDPRAAKPLSRLLKSPEANVRVAAAQALGALGDERAIPHLLALLDEGAEETQIKALTSLKAMKPPHIGGSLLKHLKHPSAAVRRRVVDVLGFIGDAEVAERLEHVLRTDPADEVRMAAARALGEIADPASVDCLKAAIHNEEFNVRCQAIGALGQIGDEECYSTLLALVNDPVPEVRFHAAVALGEVGNQNAVPVLKARLKDKNPMVVRGAAKALEKLGVEKVDQLARSAQRSKKREALDELWLSVQSWFPNTAHTQKILLGGSLAALLVVVGVGWLLYSLFKSPPTRVVVRGNVRTVSFLPGDGEVIIGRTLGLVELWDANASERLDAMTPQGGERIVSTPNPKTLAIVGASAVQLWEIGSDERPPAPSGHSQPIAQYAASANRSFMVTLSSDGVAMVWDLSTGQPRRSIQLPVREARGLSISADGSVLAGGNDKGGATVWNASTGETVRQFAGDAAVTATALSANGKTLVVAYAKGLLVWNAETGEKLAAFDAVGSLTGLQFDPSGKWMAGVEGATAWIWDAAQLADANARPRQIPTSASSIATFAFSSDGSKLAFGGPEDSAVWLHETATGRELSQLDIRDK